MSFHHRTQNLLRPFGSGKAQCDLLSTRFEPDLEVEKGAALALELDKLGEALESTRFDREPEGVAVLEILDPQYALEKLARTVEKVRKRYNPKLQLIGVLVSKFDTRTKLDKDIYNALTAKFGEERVFPPVHDAVKFRQATVYNQTIFEQAPGEQPALQFANVVEQLVDRVTTALTPSIHVEPKAAAGEVVNA